MRAIAGLHVGDLVQAEDPRTGKVEAEPVLAVIDDGVKPLLAVGLSDGSTVRVTANHPFWVDSGAALAAPGWLPAGDLRTGDRLRTEDGRDVAVLGIREGAGSAHVYTLTVARDHAFFVGSAGVLVHNANGISRCAYIPQTPRRYGGLWWKVYDRMLAEGKINSDGMYEHMGSFYPIEDATLGHSPVDTVEYWNSVARFEGGPKNPTIRAFMQNADNYVFQPEGPNKAAGARLKASGIVYLPPAERP